MEPPVSTRSVIPGIQTIDTVLLTSSVEDANILSSVRALYINLMGKYTYAEISTNVDSTKDRVLKSRFQNVSSGPCTFMQSRALVSRWLVGNAIFF